MIERFNPPTRYDKAPWKTICCVKDEEGAGEECFIQVSAKEDEPRWELVSEMMFKIYRKHLSDKKYVEELMILWSQES